MSSARVVILSGEGSCFCAGIDIGGLTGMVGQDFGARVMPRTMEWVQRTAGKRLR